MILPPPPGTYHESFLPKGRSELKQDIFLGICVLLACYADLFSGLMGSAMPGFTWSIAFVLVGLRKFFWLIVQAIVMVSLMQFHWGRAFYHILFEFSFIYFIFFSFKHFLYQNNFVFFLNYITFMIALSFMNGVFWPLAFQYVYSRLIWSTIFFITLNSIVHGKQKFSIFR